MKKILTVIGVLISVFAAAQPATDYTRINQRYDWLGGYFRALTIPAGTTPALATRQWPGAGAVYVDSTNHLFYFYSGGVWRTAGGATNSNVGSAFRLAIPGTNNVKTIIQRHGLIIDSVTSNSLGFQVDTTTATTGIATIGDVDRSAALKMNISDTSSMLTPYLRKSDSTNKWVQNAFINATEDSLIVYKGGVRIAYELPATGGGGGDTTTIVYVNPLSYLPVSFGSATVAQQTEAWEAAIADAQTKGYGIQFDGTWFVRTDSLRITEPLLIQGVGQKSILATADTSGAVLTVSASGPRQYYNVIFPGRKEVIIRDMVFRYVGADSTPNANQRGLLLTASSTVGFNHRVLNCTFDHFWVGAENHNIHSADYFYNTFDNNLKYGFLNTNDESQDYGKLIFAFNVMRTHDTVTGRVAAYPSAQIKLEGGAGFNIGPFNQIYGYTSRGLWADFTNTTEFFTSVGSTEHFIHDNVFSYPTEVAIYYDSDFGKTGSGSGVFNGNRIEAIDIRDNLINNTSFLRFGGGTLAPAFYDVNIEGNKYNNVTGPGNVIIDHGAALKNLVFSGNTLNNRHFGTDFNFGGTPVDITDNVAIAGFRYGHGNVYVGYDAPPEILDTDNLQHVTDNGNTTNRSMYIRDSAFGGSVPSYFRFIGSDGNASPNAAAIGAMSSEGTTNSTYLLANNGQGNGLYSFNFVSGTPQPLTIGNTGNPLLTINAASIVAGGSPTWSTYGTNRVLYTTTGGLMASDANFGFNGVSLAVGGSTFTKRLTVTDNNSVGGIALVGNNNPATSIYNGGTLLGYGPVGITSDAAFFSNSLTNDIGMRPDVSGARLLLGGPGYNNSVVMVTTSAVGINTTGNPAASALVDMVSTTKGLLVPRMNTTQQDAISSPATGLIIYNTDSLLLRQYNGSAWVTIGGGSGGGGGTTYTFTAADFNESGTTISIDYANGQAASTSLKGFLTATDWNTFNNKVSSQWTTGTGVYHMGPVTTGANSPEPNSGLTVVVNGETDFGIALLDNSTGGHSYRWHPRAGGVDGQIGLYDVTGTAYRYLFTATGNMGIGNVTSPTAKLHLPAGTATANTAPLKFTTGTNLTSAEAGAMEYDGSNFFLSPSTTRKQIPLFTAGTPSNGQILIGNGTDFTKATVTAGTGISITNGSGSVTVGVNSGFITSGTYLPTGTAVASITTVTPNANTTFTRIGDIVTVSGTLLVNPAAEFINSEFALSLPIPSDFSASTEGGGAGAIESATINNSSVVINMDATNDRASFRFHAPLDGSSVLLTFTFSYKVTPP